MNVTVVCDNCGSCAFKDFIIREIASVQVNGKDATRLKMECRNCKVPYTTVVQKIHDQPVGAGKRIDMDAEAMINSNARVDNNFVTRYSDRSPQR